MSIEVDEGKATAESEATCKCGRRVFFGYLVKDPAIGRSAPMTKHELPACDLFVKTDSDTYRRRIIG